MKREIRKLLLDKQFWIAVIAGWLISGYLWKETRKENSVEESTKCLPCVDKTCPTCVHEEESRDGVGLKSDFYREFAWKPQSSLEDELTHWKMMTNTKKDGMFNEEPRIGINGMWKLEQQEIEMFSKHHFLQTEIDSGNAKFVRMMRGIDPFYGVSYIVNVDVTKSSSKSSRSVEIHRKFKSGKPNLISIKYLDYKEIVHVITPLSKVTERFHKFIERLEQNIYFSDDPVAVRLLFVIFWQDDDNEWQNAVEVLKKFRQRNPAVVMEIVFENAPFSRAVGLDAGVKKCELGDLMLFLDVDLSITHQFLDRIRANTIHHKRAVFPVMFSQFNPKVISTYMKTLRVPMYNDGKINDSQGFWIYYAFGVASMYKSDYIKVGGFRLDITGWGGEDIDLFKKVIADSDIDVMTTVDPDLIHIYHSRSCDVELAHDQYRMCVGALSETIGSQIQLGTLYLKYNESA